MTSSLFDPRQCVLGEGPLWHPTRRQLFWFDILGQRMLSRVGDEEFEWQFDEIVSAAGWTSDTTLLIASETQLFEFDLETDEQTYVAPLEIDNDATRSNDGRADPYGGFWISTMGKSGEQHAGSIYRYYRGEMRRLFPKITVPNAICFAPDGATAYFSDTLSGQIQQVALDDHGWPTGNPSVFVDLRADGLLPDGAVTDAAGNLWNAQWGAARVAGYTPQGTFIESFAFPAHNTSCPAFGGPDLTTMFCTSAQEHLSAETIKAEPANGQTFQTATPHKGWPEPQVIL